MLFADAYAKDKGPWIMKPVASSRGRGISLVTSVSACKNIVWLLVRKYFSLIWLPADNT